MDKRNLTSRGYTVSSISRTKISLDTYLRHIDHYGNWNFMTIFTSLYHFLFQINTIHVLSFYYFKIYFKIIFPFFPRSSKWPSSFRLPQQIPVYIFIPHHPCYTSQTFQPRWFEPPEYLVSRKNEAPHHEIFSILQWNDLTALKTSTSGIISIVSET